MIFLQIVAGTLIQFKSRFLTYSDMQNKTSNKLENFVGQ